MERGLNRLTPSFKQKVELFLNEVGNEIFITESYRSRQRQKELYAQGRTTKGAIVTWTLDSEHCYGRAIDIAFNGNELYPIEQSKWDRIYDIAKKYGIDSGYRLWGTDKPHLQDDLKLLNIKKMETTEYRNLLKNNKDIPKELLFNNYDKDGEMKALITLGLNKLYKLLSK